MIRGELLERVPALAALTKPARAEIAAGATFRDWRQGQALWEAGDRARGLFVLFEGSVRVVREDADRQLLVHTVDETGSLFGEVPLFAGGGYPARALAAGATTCAVVPQTVLRAAMAIDPQLAEVLLTSLARRVDQLVGRLGRLARGKVRDRLVGRILSDAEIDGERIVVRYGTHETMAQEIGTVREVVSREIARLRRAGLVESERRGILVIRDHGALAAELREHGDSGH